MLTRYLENRSRDLNEIEASFFANGNGNRIDLPGGRPEGEFIANAARFLDGALVFARYDAPITLGFDPADSIRLLYQSGTGSEIVLDGKQIENVSSRSGCLITDDRPWHARHASGLAQLTLKIPIATLDRKLAACLGSNSVRLDLWQPSQADPRLAARLRAAVFRFAGELEAVDERFLPGLVASSIDNVCFEILTCLSDRMVPGRRAPAAPSAVQLGRVEQYLVACYAEPLTVETLAQISGVDARSVTWYFRSTHACTPQQYLERVRLQIAHLKLRLYPDDQTVESVALQCGFPSPGTFRQAYRKKFGVLPAPKTAHRPLARHGADE